MYHRSPRPFSPAGLLLAMLLPALLSGCGGPSIDLLEGSSPEQARRLLADTARKGPVLLRAFDDRLATPVPGSGSDSGLGSLDADGLRRAASQGIGGLSVTFTGDEAAAVVGPRLVLAQGQHGGAICTSDPTGVGNGFRAGFCDGEEPVAVVTVELGEDPLDKRAVWQAMRRLFPDDYPSTYGFGWLGNRISIGVGMSF